MGKTILTPQQSHFLELASEDPEITKRFYLTGGTALAEFYYRHRLSEDIDLFCEAEEIDPKLTESLLRKYARRLGVTEIKRSQFLGLVSFLLIYQNKAQLKVDFNYYPFLRIAKGKKYNRLSIDSVYDIAVNKVHTLFMKPRVRDYVDFYLILTTENYPLRSLVIDAKAKFDWHIDDTTLGSQLLRVSDFSDLPTMLIPFDRKKMEDFFVHLAKSLKSEIFIS